MTERWLPIVRLEGLYEVSNQGRVRSLDRVVEMKSRWGGTIKRFHRGRVLKTSPVSVAPDFPRGYLGFHPSVDGKHQSVMVHRCVLEAFEGPPPFARAETRHLNGDSHDNRAANLAWGTCAENTADRERHGTILRGDCAPNTKLTTLKLAQARFLTEHGRPLHKVAVQLGVSAKSLSARLVASGYSVGRGRKSYA